MSLVEWDCDVGARQPAGILSRFSYAPLRFQYQCSVRCILVNQTPLGHFQERRFRRALSFVLLWKSGTVKSALGSVLGFFCIMAIPLAEYIWLRPVKESEEELPFRGLVLSLEVRFFKSSFSIWNRNL